MSTKHRTYMEVRQGGIENKNLNTVYSFKKFEISQHNILPLKKNVQVQTRVYGHSCHAKHRCVQEVNSIHV